MIILYTILMFFSFPTPIFQVTELAETMDTEPEIVERKIYLEPARTYIPTFEDLDFDIDL